MPTRIAQSDIVQSDIVGASRGVPVADMVRPVLDLGDVGIPRRTAPAIDAPPVLPTRRLAADSGLVGASDLMPRRRKPRQPAPVGTPEPAVVSARVDERDLAQRLLDAAMRAANDNRVRIAAWSVVLALLVFGVFGEAIDRSLTNVIEVAPPVHGNGIA